MKFQVNHTDGAARIGQLETSHGAVETPIFMPVGTVGAVKAISPDDLHALGAQIVLGNTYHLYLRPGADLVAAHGGLAEFSGWHGPMLTDSGGFQVLSLGRGKTGQKLATVTEDGVTFRSHLDGSAHRFTPEGVLEVEQQLGADIIMPLDDVPPADTTGVLAEETVERTSRWLKRQADYWRANLDTEQQALFGIIQGGADPALRRRSADAAVSQDLPGYAIGGISTGRPPTPNVWSVVADTAGLLPGDKPRYLMGVGEPLTFLEAINCGVDMMDCVLPTRLARHGSVWLITPPTGRQVDPGGWVAAMLADGGDGWHGQRIDLGKTAYIGDITSLMPGCTCLACTLYHKGTLAHFVRIKEPNALRLLSLHNLSILFDLERAAKQDIRAGQYQNLLTVFRRVWSTNPLS